MKDERTEKIEKKILEIRETLISKLPLNSNSRSNGFFEGKSGLAISTFAMSEYYKDDQLKALTHSLVKKCIRSINNGNMSYSFSNGIAGLGWCLNYLKVNGFYSADDIAFIYEIDEYLFKVMVKDLKQGNFDYLHGSTGICLYFLQNLTNKHMGYIHTYIDLLEEIAIKERNTYKWESIIDHKTGIRGFGLGMAHGIPSIISILSKVIKLGINKLKAQSMLEGSINFLLSNLQDTKLNMCYFPHAINKNPESTKSRMAWCNGDLGISISLYQASLVVGNNDWKKLSEEILEFSSKRKDIQSEMVFDAGICHGSSGIAQIYNRMYFNTRKNIYKINRDFWVDITIEKANFADGLAGYKAYYGKAYGGWKNNYSFLEGIAGIGLVLISSMTNLDPKWDECLLLS